MGVGVAGVVAADEGVEAFDTVDQAVFEQKFQGAVDGGRCGTGTVGAQLVQQRVGAHRLPGAQHQFQHLAAQLGQLRAMCRAARCCLVELGGNVGLGHSVYIARMTDNPLLAAIRFNADGLVPCIAQQHDTGEVLMLAWMNRAAAAETLATGRVCYWSRSRGALWRKGETSGQVQTLHDLRLDCDGDTLLALVDQEGVACHTGRRNCFFQAVRGGVLVEIAAPLILPERLYGG